MKLLRFGPPGQERPGLLDADGRPRDLSGHMRDVDPGCLGPGGHAALAKIDQNTLPLMLSKIPIRRCGEIAEIVALIRWLAREECSFSTGAVFDASGGRATY